MYSKNSLNLTDSNIISIHHNNLAVAHAPNLRNGSKCAIVAVVVSGVAGIVIIVLSGINLFGPIGSVGFIASMAGGGALVCTALGGVVWIAIVNCKDRSQVLQSNELDTPTTIVDTDLGNSISSKKTKSKTVSSHPKDEPDISPQHKRRQQSSPQVSSNNVTKGKPTSVLQDKIKKYHTRQDHFRAAASARMQRKPVASVDLPNCRDQEFISNAQEALKHIDYNMPPESPIKTFGGGEHVCVTSNKIPGVLFKKMRGSPHEDMVAYVQQANNARKICEEKNLYLLFVPKCQVVDWDPYVVMEERAELLEGGWESQRACYQWAIQDSALQPYSKELLRQLTIFICLMELGDVSYDNMPIMRDGRVALFDLDKRGAVIGLTQGCAREENGLFNMLPIEWFNEFIAIAQQYLKGKDIDLLNKSLPKLRQKAQERHECTKKMNQFYQNQNITDPTQPLDFDQKLFNKKYKLEVAIFAEKTVERLNQQIASLRSISMAAGREIRIDTNIGTKFFNDIVNNPKIASKKIWHKEFKAIKEEGLRALQEEGYIFSYEIDEMFNFISVIC